MKVAIVVHMYPYNNKGLAGGELFIHGLLKALKNIEFKVYNLVTDWRECTEGRPVKWNYDGIDVELLYNINTLPLDYDGYVCHLASSEQVMKYCISHGKVCFQIAHNISTYHLIPMLMNHANPIRVIYNCETIKKALNYGHVPGYVFTPPIDTEHFAIDSDTYYNRYITIINNIPAKGINTFKKLAELIPQREFLVVKGGYCKSEQVLDFPKNVTLIEPQTDMRKVYQQSRILIYMSHHESYGMCAQEAQAAGIPVIAYACDLTKGLMENLGSSGLYVFYDVNDMVGYIEHINKLDNHFEYRRLSILGMQNVQKKDTKYRIDGLEQFIEKECANYLSTNEICI
jgi:glycosyltransferase involved in cell wall biosynthesis